MGRSSRLSPVNYRRCVWDFAGVAGLAILSLAIGLAISRFSSAPVALVYRSPGERLEAQLNELVAVPQPQVSLLRLIGLSEFRVLADNGSALIIDARARPFYEQGHVPGALNLSRERFGQDYRRLRSVLESQRTKQIIVYCSGPQCKDSAMVARALITLGFAHVQVFAGGWQAWTEAGLSVGRR